MSDLLKLSHHKELILLIGLFLGMPDIVNCQHITYGQYKRAGKTAFDHKDYYNAFRFYRDALAFNKEDSLIYEKAAESAMHSWKNDTARILFEKLLNFNFEDCDTMRLKSYYLLSLLYQREGEYALAMETLEKALSSCSAEDYKRHLQELKESIAWAIGRKDSWDERVIEGPIKMQLGKECCDNHALAPVYWNKDTLLFTRQFFSSTCYDDFVHQVGEVAIVDSSKYQVFMDTLSGRKNDTSVGYLTFNHNRTRIYYATCKAVNTTDQHCTIMTQSLDKDSLVSPQFVLDLGDSYTYTHPNYIWDSISDREGLYFVSDRDGESGDTDIWFGWLSDNGKKLDSYSLDRIKGVNSTANEISPYYDMRTRTLYYSSDRLDDGKSYGGMDIYAASDSGDWKTFHDISILKRPINSSKHDIFYSIHGDTAWFSSNRLDSSGMIGGENSEPLSTKSHDLCDTACQEDAYCYKIFSAIDTFPKECQVYFCPQIINYCTSDTIPIESVSIKLFLAGGGDSIPFNKAKKRFPVTRGKDYLLIVEREGFAKGQIPIKIRESEFENVPWGEDCCVDCCVLYLKPKSSTLKVITGYHCPPSDTLLPLHGCTVLLLDSQKSICLERQASDTFDFGLQELKTYTLEVRHPDFATRIFHLPISYQRRDTCETIVRVNMNEEISLYFENDVPGSSNQSDTLSRLLYSTTAAGDDDNLIGYASEVREKEYKFHGFRHEATIDSFFDQMRTQIHAYQSLKSWMYDKFTADPSDTVHLLIEGRASPLAEDRYNMALSQRRIHSVLQDIKQDPWLRRFDKNILLNPGPRGEEESRSMGVSDDKNNPVESIYNPKAARERRTTIRILPKGCQDNVKR